MLRAVTFDLWETLLYEDAEIETSRRAYRVRETRRLLAGVGIDLRPETLEAAHQSVIARMPPYWTHNLDVSVVEQTKVFLEGALGGPVEKRIPPAALLEC